MGQVPGGKREGTVSEELAARKVVHPRKLWITRTQTARAAGREGQHKLNLSPNYT